MSEYHPHHLAARVSLGAFYRNRLNELLKNLPKEFPNRLAAEQALAGAPNLQPLVIVEAKKFFTGDHV